MKKIKLSFILFIAIVGALLIYNNFDHVDVEKKEIDKFLEEYTLLDENHAYEIKNIDEIINILNKNGIVFFCNSGSDWCQYYAKMLDDVAVKSNINKIYYVDIKEDRNNNSTKYQKIVKKLYNYLDIDDTGNKRLSMPMLVFIKNGNVIASDTTTYRVSSDTTPKEYWTDLNITNFENRINEYIELLNNYEKEEIK